MLQYLVLLGAAVYLVGVAFYIRETLFGKTKPNRVSWLIWGLISMIATVAAFSEGARWSILPIFMSGFGPLLVFSASFFNRNAYWKLGSFDYICGLFYLLGVFFWLTTKNPIFAIIFAIVADTFAAIPTLKNVVLSRNRNHFLLHCRVF